MKNHDIMRVIRFKISEKSAFGKPTLAPDPSAQTYQMPRGQPYVPTPRQDAKALSTPRVSPRNMPMAFSGGVRHRGFGRLIGLGDAEVRLPLLIGAFRFAALEAVICNKAMTRSQFKQT